MATPTTLPMALNRVYDSKVEAETPVVAPKQTIPPKPNRNKKKRQRKSTAVSKTN
jgi:hypothetical protein